MNIDIHLSPECSCYFSAVPLTNVIQNGYFNVSLDKDYAEVSIESWKVLSMIDGSWSHDKLQGNFPSRPKTYRRSSEETETFGLLDWPGSTLHPLPLLNCLRVSWLIEKASPKTSCRRSQVIEVSDGFLTLSFVSVRRC